MNGIDHTVETRPALLARLQATMPPNNGARPAAAGDNDAPEGVNAKKTSRLHHTTFTSASRPSHPRETFPVFRNTEPPKPRSVFGLAFDAIWTHRWLITALTIAGAMLGCIYNAQFCVPLFKIRASIELQNPKSEFSAEAFARVLESQSLMVSTLAALPEAERRTLVETPRLPSLVPEDMNERLHDRLTAVAIPSAQVIDLQLISPSRQAGVDFLNTLIKSLIRRDADPGVLSALPSLDSSGAQGRLADTISIIDPASASSHAVSPSLPLNLLLGILSGAALSIAFALIRMFASNTFRGPGSVSQVLGMRELGAIPERKLLLAGDSDSPIAAQMDPNDESLRYLRSSLLYHPDRQEVRCLAFTSAAPGEGKTTVVTNLSMSLAATGRRVLVIDGDLRRPRLYKLLQVPQGPGLSDLLRRDPAGPPAVLSKYVSPTSFQNLYVLPPGTAGTDSPELLAGPMLAKLIRDIGKSFDFVLIDTPPVLACSDARNYARAVEGVVLVVRSSETQKRAALVARDMLLQDGATIIGTVLTGWRQVYPAYNYPSTATYART